MGIFVKGIRRPGRRTIEIELPNPLDPDNNWAEVMGSSIFINAENSYNAYLPFVSIGDGSEDLVDLSTPDHMTVIEGGLYSATVVCNLMGLYDVDEEDFVDWQEGGAITFELSFHPEGKDGICRETILGAPGMARIGISRSLSLQFPIPAGGGIRVRAFNYDAAASASVRVEECMLMRLA